MIKELQIPGNTTAVVNGSIVSVSGKEGKVTKEFKSRLLTIALDHDKVKLTSVNDRKKTLAILNTTAAIINNMIKGVNEKYTYVLRSLYSHFPLSLSIKGKSFLVSNFTGERSPRVTNILNNVEVTIKGKDIEVTSVDKELAGIVAGNIESRMCVAGKDRRVFQDGVYIVKKAQAKVFTNE